MNHISASLTKTGMILLVLLFMGSCSQKQKKSLSPMEIPVVNVLQQDVPVYQDFVGQIYGEFDIPIRARVSGFLESIHFDQGTYVEKGQLLYMVDPQPLEAQLAGELSNLAEAKTQLAKAESDLGRIKPLAKINAVSQSDLDAAQAQYDAAVANVQAVGAGVRLAEINLSYCNIKSPITGLIGKTEAKVGEFVGQDPNPVILNTVSTIDTIHVEFYLVESDYLGLARRFVESEVQRQEADYVDDDRIKDSKISLILSDGSTFEHNGWVNFVDREVNSETGSLMVQAAFPNPDEILRPGQYAKVRIRINQLTDALLIPQKCVMELQGTHSVFVVNDSSMVESRQIVTGPTYNDYWIVESGLEPDEKVVIDALQKVKSGMPVMPKQVEFKSVLNNNN